MLVVHSSLWAFDGHLDYRIPARPQEKKSAGSISSLVSAAAASCLLSSDWSYWVLVAEAAEETRRMEMMERRNPELLPIAARSVLREKGRRRV